MQTITPFLWFNNNAEEAIEFYTSLFADSEVLNISRMGEGQSVVMGAFRLNGQEFMALNGGPAHANFTPAISFMISCEDQAEIDHLWDSLADGGQPLQCGWVTDRFGITWQVVPRDLGRLMSSGTPEQSARVQAALLQMVKLDLGVLKAAFDSE